MGHRGRRVGLSLRPLCPGLIVDKVEWRVWCPYAQLVRCCHLLRARRERVEGRVMGLEGWVVCVPSTEYRVASTEYQVPSTHKWAWIGSQAAEWGFGSLRDLGLG